MGGFAAATTTADHQERQETGADQTKETRLAEPPHLIILPSGGQGSIPLRLVGNLGISGLNVPGAHGFHELASSSTRFAGRDPPQAGGGSTVTGPNSTSCQA